MAELILDYADEDFWPDPRTWDEINFGYTVESIIGLLNQAARGEHTAWALSSAVASIMLPHGRRGGLGPSLRERDRILEAIGSTYLTADRTLPPRCRRSKILTGMEALASLVAYWAAENEQRAALPRDTYLDVGAYVRIFRNELHNISLAEEIKDRAEKRRSELITALL